MKSLTFSMVCSVGIVLIASTIWSFLLSERSQEAFIVGVIESVHKLRRKMVSFLKSICIIIAFYGVFVYFINFPALSFCISSFIDSCVSLPFSREFIISLLCFKSFSNLTIFSGFSASLNCLSVSLSAFFIPA